MMKNKFQEWFQRALPHFKENDDITFKTGAKVEKMIW
jgi:hypothetical protein